MPMPLSLNYKFLILLAGTTTLFAFLLNLAISNLLWEKGQQLPLWGQRSIATYLFAFGILTSFGVSWFASRATRWALRNGRVLPLHWHLKSQTLIDKLPSRTFNRAFMFALAGFSLAAILVLLLDTLQYYAVPYADFILLSSIFSISLTVAITSMANYRALGDTIVGHLKV
jgi:hypothetical protein